MGHQLNNLPTEILSSITGYLGTGALYRLCLSGDQLLHHRFETGSVLHVNYYPFILESRPPCPLKLPSFWRGFRQLRSISVQIRNFNTSYYATYVTFPEIFQSSFIGLAETLSSISIIIPDQYVFPRSNDFLACLYDNYPNLSSVTGAPSLHLESIKSHLKRIKRLEIDYWNVEDACTQELENLEQLIITRRVQAVKAPKSPPIALPNSLLSLDMDILPQHYVTPPDDKEFWSWPPHLTSLRLRSCLPSYVQIQHLPPSLRSLDIRDTFSLPDGFTSALPRNLTSLIYSMLNANEETISGLPPGLLTLGTVSCPSNESILSLLPRTLTKLRFISPANFEGDVLPQGLKILTMEVPRAIVGKRTWDVSLLPASLTELNILPGPIPMNLKIDFEPYHPPTEEDLEPILDESDELMDDLDPYDPSSAMDLDAPEPATATNLIPLLAISLHLPPSQLLEYTLLSLPQTITKLVLDCRRRDLDAEWLSYLPPILLEFSFTGLISNRNFFAEKDGGIKTLLPSSLTALSISSPFSSLYSVSSAVFEYLPPSILYLHMHLLSLNEDHFSSLPRSLLSAVFSPPSFGELSLELAIDKLHQLPTRLHYLQLGWKILNLAELKRAFRPRVIEGLVLFEGLPAARPPGRILAL